MSRRRRSHEDTTPEAAARLEELRRRSGGRLVPDRPRRRKAIACQDLVEQVTAYLDGALTPAEVSAIDRHLEVCADCTRVLAQWRQVVDLTGRLAEDDVDGLDASTRAELLAAFRALPPAPD